MCSSDLCFDAQRVNIRLHQTAKRTIYHAVSFQSPDACEALRHDSYVKMTAPVSCPRVPRMAMTVVDDLELFRGECLLEPRANRCNARFGHGRTWMTGLISTSPNTPSTTYGSRADHA